MSVGTSSRSSEIKGRVLIGLRRGATAGALGSGVSLVLVAMLFFFCSLLHARAMARPLPSHTFAFAPASVGAAWIIGTAFGAAAGMCGGVIRAWTRQLATSLIAGVLLGLVTYWLLMLALLSLVLVGSAIRSDGIHVMAFFFSVLGVIPGLCGALWGVR